MHLVGDLFQLYDSFLGYDLLVFVMLVNSTRHSSVFVHLPANRRLSSFLPQLPGIQNMLGKSAHFHVDIRTDIHDEANGKCSQFCEKA